MFAIYEFLQTQSFKPLVWLRFIDDMFFIWTHGEENLENFMKELNIEAVVQRCSVKKVFLEIS